MKKTGKNLTVYFRHLLQQHFALIFIFAVNSEHYPKYGKSHLVVTNVEIISAKVLATVGNQWISFCLRITSGLEYLLFIVSVVGEVFLQQDVCPAIIFTTCYLSQRYPMVQVLRRKLSFP